MSCKFPNSSKYTSEKKKLQKKITKKRAIKECTLFMKERWGSATPFFQKEGLGSATPFFDKEWERSGTLKKRERLTHWLSALWSACRFSRRIRIWKGASKFVIQLLYYITPNDYETPWRKCWQSFIKWNNQSAKWKKFNRYKLYSYWQLSNHWRNRINLWGKIEIFYIVYFSLFWTLLISKKHIHITLNFMPSTLLLIQQSFIVQIQMGW